MVRLIVFFVFNLSKFRGIKYREFEVVKDCINIMGDSVDQFSCLMKEIGYMGYFNGQDFLWYMSNVQIWVSVVFINENICVDGFFGYFMDGKMKSVIRMRVINVV